jgi:hypothetical protein
MEQRSRFSSSVMILFHPKEEKLMKKQLTFALVAMLALGSDAAFARNGGGSDPIVCEMYKKDTEGDGCHPLLKDSGKTLAGGHLQLAAAATALASMLRSALLSQEPAHTSRRRPRERRSLGPGR